MKKKSSLSFLLDIILCHHYFYIFSTLKSVYLLSNDLNDERLKKWNSFRYLCSDIPTFIQTSKAFGKSFSLDFSFFQMSLKCFSQLSFVIFLRNSFSVIVAFVKRNKAEDCVKIPNEINFEIACSKRLLLFPFFSRRISTLAPHVN